ncbi:hypothetical protein [Insolitispirillum peregrinum]|uniref:Uncharacterized protein n=1 Tax=Insolitispirillum peregrinum TaxID=80876 RepID=A0A1N7P238_9PROT|nr:hypothetical protein [Insolitispirillum peregrinum]SIT04641.1 hypothetical protein SAMN05421779_1065 [Insolitispirillum peregrinum]
MSTVSPREGVGALASVRQVPPGILAGAIIPTMMGGAKILEQNQLSTTKQYCHP